MKFSFDKKAIFICIAFFTLLLYGCNTAEEDSSEETYSNQDQPEESVDLKDNPPEEPMEEEETVEEYIPRDTDVVLKNNSLENVELLEEFIAVAGENGQDNESAIRIVKFVPPRGAIIYDLISRYDANANQAWIAVKPDMSYYQPHEDDLQEVFNNAPQQCSYMTKDEIEGNYKLFECRTHWEYRILPVVGDTGGNL